MTELTNAVKRTMESNPDIAKAIQEGYTLRDIVNPRRIRMRMGSAIGMAQYRYGPSAPEVQKAIDEANHVSVMATNARAAYNRILRDGPPDAPVEAAEPEETLAPEPQEEPEWDPVWSAKPYAVYRELQNIPEHWGIRKVVLIWRRESFQRLRVFAHHPEFDRAAALLELTGVRDLPVVSNRGLRWDFILRRDQYDTAVSDADD